MASIFGNVHLGYIVIETDRFADWRRFGRDAIGMHIDDTLSNVMRFRLDDNACRFLFDEIMSRVSKHGVPITEGTAEEAALRGVERLVRFPGPNGLAQEIFTLSRTSDTPLEMRVGGFVIGDGGIGHVAVTTKKPYQIRGYYNTVFDARLSDYIDETISGLKLKIRFLRVNQRHHSVAIAAVNRLPINPIRTRIQHLNIQLVDLDDMTASYQRVKELGFHMALAVGQHTNDRELSYYAMTPSGFEWEVGWNPIVIDEKTWEPTTYQGISIWGHTREGQTIIDKLGQFKTAATSLLHREDTIPALSGAGISDD
jgi:2,3-dihydroxybiphenyl 1,2-dioxygenase